MAHLLEHLVFKGTPRHPNIPQELTAHGARPNGTTWLDRTNYFETFQASDANLEWALDLESDRMVNSFIAKKDLDSEMTVVRNEFEAGENEPVLHRLRARDVDRVSLAQLRQVHDRRAVRPRECADRSAAGVLQELLPARQRHPARRRTRSTRRRPSGSIDKYFRGIPRPTRVIQPTYTSEPTQDGERAVTLRRVGDVQLAGALYHVPPGAHADYAEHRGARPRARIDAVGPAAQGARGREESGVDWLVRVPASRARRDVVRSDGPARHVPRRRQRHAHRDGRTDGARQRPRKSSAPRPSY